MAPQAHDRQPKRSDSQNELSRCKNRAAARPLQRRQACIAGTCPGRQTCQYAQPPAVGPGFGHSGIGACDHPCPVGQAHNQDYTPGGVRPEVDAKHRVEIYGNFELRPIPADQGNATWSNVHDHARSPFDRIKP
jgi:hypothetical protein